MPLQSERRKLSSKKSVMTVIMMCFVLSTILFVNESVVANAAVTGHPDLTLKWTASVSGGGEALLTADVRSDFAGEEVFHAGGPAQPNSSSGI